MCALSVVKCVGNGKRSVDDGKEFVDTGWVCDGDSKVSWAGHVSPDSGCRPCYMYKQSIHTTYKTTSKSSEY